MTNKTLIKVKVRDTHDILYEDQVERINSFNEVGPFDVYPMHANFISIVHKQISFITNNKVVKKFDIEQAVMKVKKDEVHIFLGIEAFVLEPGQSTNGTART